MREFGSPTMLVNGCDAAGSEAPGASSCRIYQLQAGRLSAVPAALASMIPAAGCPLCWPAYAALLSSAGLGVLASPRYRFFLTAGLLIVAMTGLGIEARRSGYAPLVLGRASAVPRYLN